MDWEYTGELVSCFYIDIQRHIGCYEHLALEAGRECITPLVLNVHDVAAKH